MRTLFFTLLLASLLGGFFASVESTQEPDPCSDPTVYCGRLRVPGG